MRDVAMFDKKVNLVFELRNDVSKESRVVWAAGHVKIGNCINFLPIYD